MDVVLSRRTLLALGGAVVVAGCGSAKGPSKGGAPGTVSVSPQPGARHAPKGTELSFRGVTADDLGTITIKGSSSDQHTFDLKAHSDSQGVSVLPQEPFTVGETVTVTHGLPDISGSKGSFSFTVADSVKLVTAPIPAIAGQAPVFWEFASEPELEVLKYSVDTPAKGTAKGLITTAPYFIGPTSGAMLTDDAANPVWWLPAPAGLSHYATHVQTFKGKPVITFWQGQVLLPGLGLGDVHMLDETYTEIASWHAGNGLDADGHSSDSHETLLTAAGTAMLVVYVPTKVDLSKVGGPKDGVVLDCVAQEIEPETGRVVWEWHALDHIDVAESFLPIAPLPLGQWDAFHMNAIDPVADDEVLISLRNTHTVLRVKKSTGEVVWRLGGKKSDWTMGDGTVFHSQHDARGRDDGTISLFDNGSGAGMAGVHPPRGLVLSLDDATKKATVKLELPSPKPRTAGSQGSCQLLDGGHWFVGWGAGAAYTEFDESGACVLDVDQTSFVASYTARRNAWKGSPTTKPQVAVAGGQVHASWNGATEVFGWRLLTGPSADALTRASQVRRSGFETSMALTGSPTFVAVAALDSAGAVIGTSEAVSAV